MFEFIPASIWLNLAWFINILFHFILSWLHYRSFINSLHSLIFAFLFKPWIPIHQLTSLFIQSFNSWLNCSWLFNSNYDISASSWIQIQLCFQFDSFWLNVFNQHSSNKSWMNSMAEIRKHSSIGIDEFWQIKTNWNVMKFGLMAATAASLIH